LTGAGAKQLRCTVGDVTFIAKSGNIVEQKCDAIVNSTDEKLNLSRGMFTCLFDTDFISITSCKFCSFERLMLLVNASFLMHQVMQSRSYSNLHPEGLTGRALDVRDGDDERLAA